MRWSLFILLFTTPVIIQAQDSAFILLNNPSFEDQAAPSRPPLSWFFCGDREESPPDIQPNGIFGPTPAPYHGETYLGMVTRYNGTYESVGQRLATPIKGGHCYSWTVHALRSPHYISTSRDNPTAPLDYNNPLILRIWGGNSVCDHRELLSQSPPVLDTNWQNLNFILKPSIDYSFILLEAYYYKRVGDAYNGNLMLDQAGPLLPLDCETRQELAVALKIELPTFPTTTALRQWLSQMGPQLQFAPYASHLEKTYFQASNDQFITGNPILWQLASVLHAFPDLRLQLGIPAASKQQYNERVLMILLEIRELGLSAEPFDFVRIRKHKSSADWLNSGPNDPVWIRLKGK